MSAGRSQNPAPKLSRAEVWTLGVPFKDAPLLLPGVLATALVVVVGTFATTRLGETLLRAQNLDPATTKNPLSPMLAAILVGLLVGNLLRLPKSIAKGADFCAKRILRLGIMALGVKLSLGELAKLGFDALPAVALVVVAGLAVVPWIASFLGVRGPLADLAAASTSICGVSATLAVAPVVDADEKDVAVTVANVTLFGLAAMFVHPWIAHACFSDAPVSAGLFLGTAVHDTSQVTGAATVYAQLFGAKVAADAAIVTKLARNLCLVAVVPYFAWRRAKRAGTSGKVGSLGGLVPMFVVGFVAAAVLRTIGDSGVEGADGRAFGVFDAAAWKSLTHAIGETGSTRCLAAAMAALGLTTSFSKLKAAGPRPFALGGLAAIAVALAGLGAAAIFGR
jgi:uncharacterized integral membrane protein (TIGR00698 family)